jgi:hypothetical protein
MIEKTLEELRRLEDLTETFELGIIGAEELVGALFKIIMQGEQGRAWTAAGNRLIRIDVLPEEDPVAESLPVSPPDRRVRLDIWAARSGWGHEWRYQYIMGHVKADRFALMELEMVIERLGQTIADEIASKRSPSPGENSAQVESLPNQAQI